MGKKKLKNDGLVVFGLLLLILNLIVFVYYAHADVENFLSQFHGMFYFMMNLCLIVAFFMVAGVMVFFEMVALFIFFLFMEQVFG